MEDLITRCKKGDKQAWGELYTQWSPYAYSIIQRYGISPGSVVDELQEAFIQVFLHLDKFDQKKGDFKWWLRKVVVNKCLMTIRANKSSATARVIDIDQAYDISSEEMSALDRMSADDLLAVINSIPEALRCVFNLYCIDGYKHTEIAELLDISEQNSRIRLSRAKKYLRETLATRKKFSQYGI